MESPETDAVAYTNTGAGAIISQLKSRIQSVRCIYNSQETFLLSRLENNYQSFLKAQKTWETAQQNCQCKLNLLQGRRDQEVYRLEMKVLRYRILNQYGKQTWIRAYELAKKHEDSPEDLEVSDLGDPDSDPPGTPDLEKGQDLEEIERQIAKDLLDNKLGIWFSQEMEEWEDVIYSRSPKTIEIIFKEEKPVNERNPLDMV